MRYVILSLGALLGAGLLAVLLQGNEQRAFNRDTLCIGYAVEAPYAFVLGDGTVTGESPEVARKIAGKLGIRHVTWRQVDFSALIPELEDGRIDVIAAGMFITPGRAEKIRFSEPSFHVRPALLVAQGNPLKIRSYHDILISNEIRCAVLSGSVEEKELRTLGMSAARLLPVPDALTGRVALENGLAHCLALSAPTLRWMAREDALGRNHLVENVEDGGSSRLGYGGFGFRRDDTELLQAWNKELHAFVGSPEHRKLIAGFGFSDQELPGNMSTAEVLSR